MELDHRLFLVKATQVGKMGSVMVRAHLGARHMEVVYVTDFKHSPLVQFNRKKLERIYSIELFCLNKSGEEKGLKN